MVVPHWPPAGGGLSRRHRRSIEHHTQVPDAVMTGEMLEFRLLLMMKMVTLAVQRGESGLGRL